MKTKEKEIPITDLIKSWQDILIYLYETEDFLPFKSPNNAEERCLNALSKIMRITSVYNNGWKPDWNNSKENKYFPYRYKNSDGVLSMRCSCTLYGHHCPSGVHFRTEELALDAIRKFEDIYNDYFMIQDE